MRRRTVQRRVAGDHVLVADLSPALIFDPDLPSEVAGEPGQSPAILDKGVDRIAHRRAPVLVMADDDHATVATKEVWITMKVMLARDVDVVAGGFRPACEMALVARPAGGGVFLRVTVGVGPFHVGIADHFAWPWRRLWHGCAGRHAAIDKTHVSRDALRRGLARRRRHRRRRSPHRRSIHPSNYKPPMFPSRTPARSERPERSGARRTRIR